MCSMLLSEVTAIFGTQCQYSSMVNNNYRGLTPDTQNFACFSDSVNIPVLKIRLR